MTLGSRKCLSEDLGASFWKQDENNPLPVTVLVRSCSAPVTPRVVAMWPSYGACLCFQQVAENAPKCLWRPLRDTRRKIPYPPWVGQGERCSQHKSHADAPHGSTNSQHLATEPHQSAAAPPKRLEFQALAANPAAKLILLRWVYSCLHPYDDSTYIYIYIHIVAQILSCASSWGPPSLNTPCAYTPMMISWPL